MQHIKYNNKKLKHHVKMRNDNINIYSGRGLNYQRSYIRN